MDWRRASQRRTFSRAGEPVFRSNIPRGVAPRAPFTVRPLPLCGGGASVRRFVSGCACRAARCFLLCLFPLPLLLPAKRQPGGPRLSIGRRASSAASCCCLLRSPKPALCWPDDPRPLSIPSRAGKSLLWAVFGSLSHSCVPFDGLSCLGYRTEAEGLLDNPATLGHNSARELRGGRSAARYVVHRPLTRARRS